MISCSTTYVSHATTMVAGHARTGSSSSSRCTASSRTTVSRRQVCCSPHSSPLQMLGPGNKKQTAGLYTGISIRSASHHSWLNLLCLVKLVRLRRSAGLCAVCLNLAAHLEKQCNFIPCVCFLFIRQSFCTTTAFFLASVFPSWRIIKQINSFSSFTARDHHEGPRR